jgi:Holliday junction resolvase-like predicted endonuclease
MTAIGLWQIAEAGPARLTASTLLVERELEDWIARDPALLERGLTIVGRQLRLECGPLDLLAIDPQGRWVVIEIKRERLRRDAIAQAIDYASCLDRLDPTRLREQCDAYLQATGCMEKLDDLLDQRGQSLDGETSREIVIYLVGTGYDPGLERIVGFLTDRAELALRMVTISVFRDDQGSTLLAREIHESADEAGPAARLARPSTTSETILALADQNGLGKPARLLYETALELGFVARPYVKSIMFTPPTNRTRCLFVVWVNRRPKQPGAAETVVASEAFDQFYGIPPAQLTAAVGVVDESLYLDEPGAERVSAGLKRLFAERQAE